jgi:hypothetical protein
MPRKGQIVDLTGRTFSSWTVLRRGRQNAWGQTSWVCRCVCGKQRTVLGAPLKAGKSTNCGCLQRAAQSARMQGHGMTGTPPWNTWMAMRKRCREPGNIGWANYGGRGIRVCKEWDESFEAFWRDMGPSWEPGLTIERLDVNGHYEPRNCVWLPLSDQLRNRRPFSEWRNGKLTDLTGCVMGRWTVLRLVGRTAGEIGSPLWLCRCSCGTERAVSEHSLKQRKSRSCGCSKRRASHESLAQHRAEDMG